MTKPNPKAHTPHEPALEPQAPPKASFAYKIDDGVPIPRTRGGQTAHPYPFDKMEVNQSLFIEKGEKTVNISNIKTAAAKRVPGTKWTTRKVTEEQDGVVKHGFRIWRVE